MLKALAALGLSLVLSLAGLKCSHSRLDDLRADYRSLEAERAALESGLALCREAAALNDAVLTARELESRAITEKYNRLRARMLRGLTPLEENNAPPNPEADYASWCARPVPDLLRGLLAAGTGGGPAPLPGAAGPAPDAKGSAPAPKP